MANQQTELYKNYLETFSDVVKPTVTKNVWPVMGEGETLEITKETRKAGESYNTDVYLTSSGRIIEVEPINNGRLELFHTFENADDWRNFRKPMGMFHYLNG